MKDAKSVMEQLLDQELPPSNEQYLAYRQRVRDDIRKVQREERTMRIVAQVAWAVAGVVFLIAGVLDSYRGTVPDQLRLWAIVATMMSLACATAFLAFYLINYRPRLRKAEQDAVLLDLQRQLHELRGQLQQTANRPPSARGNDSPPKI